MPSLLDDDFSRGIVRSVEGQRIPKGGVYDCVNGLLDDDMGVYRRGGSSYLITSDVGATLLGIADVVLPTVGQVTLMWTSASLLRVSGSGYATPGSDVPRALARGVGVGDYWIAPGATSEIVTYAGLSSGAGTTPAPNADPIYVAAVGTPARLIVAEGTKAYFSAPGDHTTFGTDDFHQLPSRAQITGADSIGDSCILFTTTGVFVISNMSFELVDAYGNPQQRVEQVSKSLLLWGDPGIASFRGGLIVPGIDDVYLFGLDGTEEPISAAIRPLYRSYVKAGYQPGTAAVHRGHYFLPIVNGTTLVDVLVCRLDGGSPGWTRWDGHAAALAYAQRIGSTTRSPKLYATAGQRVSDLSGCFVPASANKSDATGTAHVLTIITRDYPVKAMVKALWREVRARFELTDAATDNPTLTAEYAVGPVAGESWTSIGSWAEGTGEAPTRLAVNKSAQAIRFRLKTSGAAASCVVRSLEVFFRGSRKR
jgi:hypothetical protein